LSGSRTIAWEVSTETLPDAFERYLVGMADLYEVSGISGHDRTHFFNATRTTLCDMGAIGRGRSVLQTLARTTAVLRRSDVDGLNILINQLPVVADCDGREVRAAAGAVQLRDLGRLSASRLEVHVDTILIPRTIAPPALLATDMHGLVLPPGSPQARLIAVHMRGLQDVAEDLSDQNVNAGVQALIVILSSITDAKLPIGTAELVALQSTVRLAAGDFIEKQLALLNGDIDIGAIATAAGVSRATLYRSFDGEGGVSRFVQDRRLHHARSALRRRMGRTPTISDIADRYGFASPTHFSRLFRARFGYSPAEVEPLKTTANVAMATGTIRHDLLTDWLKTFK
jgi:AraC-like DNA-binding protein